MNKLLILCSLFIFAACNSAKVKDSDPTRFENEISNFKPVPRNANKERIVFTGSSSIRRWQSIEDYYPDYQVINTGFGGSTMNDLQYYLNNTILQYKPDKVFIYEGDNDINNGTEITKILTSTRRIIKKINAKLPETKIVIISAKPSLARWKLRKKYIILNEEFKKLAFRYDVVFFADVWNPMLDDKGELKQEIYVEDGVHMNKEGYKIWVKIMRDYVDLK